MDLSQIYPWRKCRATPALETIPVIKLFSGEDRIERLLFDGILILVLFTSILPPRWWSILECLPEFCAITQQGSHSVAEAFCWVWLWLGGLYWYCTSPEVVLKYYRTLGFCSFRANLGITLFGVLTNCKIIKSRYVLETPPLSIHPLFPDIRSWISF